MIKLALFASGNGTNVQQITEFFRESVRVKVDCVVYNRKDAYVAERARRLGVPAFYMNKADITESSKVLDLMRDRGVDYIILAGFLLLVPQNLLDAYPNRIVNIHPALLPNYGGRGMYGHHVHEAVVAHREKETGITTVFVTHDQEEALSISDKIFLMKGGVLVQEGVGQELYRQPKNKFVAEFLGTPPINQIDCDGNEETCKNLLQNSGFLNGFTLPENLKDFVLEIRAESFSLKPLAEENAGLAVQAAVNQIYEMGKEKIAYIKTGSALVRAILTGDEDFSIGQKLNVSLKKSGVFLFCKQTGERVL